MNPKTKVFYNGQQLRTRSGKFSSVKTIMRKVWFWTKVTVIGVSALGGAGAIGAVFFSTDTVSASAPVVQTVEAKAPIMDRIADCESGNGKAGSAHQFNANGSIVIHQNSNGSVDVGKFQINMNVTNIRQMAKLGLNPLTEEGNTAYAKWLYANVGTGPWESSRKCWQ